MIITSFSEVGAEFEPFDTKSRKSLNFSTPSTKHAKSKTRGEASQNNSLLNDSFATPLTESPHGTGGDGRTSALKRRQDEMFGALSDSEGELTIDADLPDIGNVKLSDCPIYYTNFVRICLLPSIVHY